MSKVSEFLRESKSLYAKMLRHASIVVGNQAADLDSIVSAIAMSFFLSKKNKTATPHVPMINSTHAIVKSKLEVMNMFAEFSVNLDDLVFIGDSTSDMSGPVVLVDHNELDEKEKALHFDKRVSVIVDHHLDKKHFLEARPRIVDTTAGSNATLVAHLFQKEQVELPESFAHMLLYPIVGDTSNLTQLASQLDKDMVKFLLTKKELDTEKLYKQIREDKFNDERVETSVLLVKDYKQYTLSNGNKWGMSSVTLDLLKWIERDGGAEAWTEQLRDFVQRNELSFYAIISLYKGEGGDTFKRDLALVTRDDAFLDTFTERNKSECSLVRREKDFRLYSVHDVNKTRKYWQPNLEKQLNEQQPNKH